MPRNLDRRVEILFPLENPKLIRRVKEEILLTYLADTMKSQIMQSDGTYVRATPPEGQKPFSSQAFFMRMR